MMKQFKLIFLISFSAFCFFGPPVFTAGAQSSENYSIDKGTFSTGGFVGGSSENYDSESTFGEALVGQTSGGSYHAGVGFQEASAGESDDEEDEGGSGGGGNIYGSYITPFITPIVIIWQNIVNFFNPVPVNVPVAIPALVYEGSGVTGTTSTSTDVGGKNNTLGSASYTVSDINPTSARFGIKDIIALIGLLLILIFIIILWWRRRKKKESRDQNYG